MRYIFHGLFLLIMIIPCLVLIVRFVYWLIDQGLRNLARIESDPAYRRAVLATLAEKIERHPRRAELRRQRADVRRFEGDHAGVVEDLQVYLAEKPKDDAGWAELAESHLALGACSEALEAIARAIALDAKYLDYRILQAQIALVARDAARAASAIDAWCEMEAAALTGEAQRRQPRMLAGKPVPPRTADPRLSLYRAALALQQGDRAAASACLQAARAEEENLSADDMRRDRALAPLLALDEDDQLF